MPEITSIEFVEFIDAIVAHDEDRIDTFVAERVLTEANCGQVVMGLALSSGLVMRKLDDRVQPALDHGRLVVAPVFAGDGEPPWAASVAMQLLSAGIADDKDQVEALTRAVITAPDEQLSALITFQIGIFANLHDQYTEKAEANNA